MVTVYNRTWVVDVVPKLSRFQGLELFAVSINDQKLIC